MPSLEEYNAARLAFLAALRRRNWKREQYDEGEIYWSEYEPEIARFFEAERQFNSIPDPRPITPF